ncbi:hypothetical protein PIB30_060352 [Stylosanthes scabra]|uniref:Uncharacterized protein n=1 Tax=Stylosanthes scabra TaxID=79078 RepID=A0ABU6QKZ8_9FABA|nr:hypothetical protein [Stylosanthes scabra]
MTAPRVAAPQQLNDKGECVLCDAINGGKDADDPKRKRTVVKRFQWRKENEFRNLPNDGDAWLKDDKRNARMHWSCIK